MLEEVRPRKHNYVCSEEKLSCAVLTQTEVIDFYTMKRCRCQTAHLGEQRAVWNQ